MCRPQEITDTSSISTNASNLVAQCDLVGSSTTKVDVLVFIHVSASMCRPQEITDTSSISTNTSILIAQCDLVRSSTTKVDVLVFILRLYLELLRKVLWRRSV